MRLAPNDAAILARASDFFRGTNDDLATKLTARAAILDPRSASVLVRAAYDNMFQRKFGEVGRIGEAILALDSTDERGWTQVFLAQAMRGDTTTMRRTAERMLLSIPRPGVNLASWALLVDPAMRRRYLSRSGSERQISSVSDSIQDIDNRMIAALLLRDTLRARAHAETLIAFALKANARRHLAPYIRVGIAHAQAIAGMNADASTTLSSAIQEARGAGTEQYPARELQADDVAGVYGLLGNPSEAVRWLEAGLKSTYTMRWFAVYPRLDALRRTPEYREFVRKHPQ